MGVKLLFFTMTNCGIFSSCYLAPVEYYYFLLQQENNILDIHENFIKQTYRNRCTILGANGKLDLIIPIQKRKNHTSIKDIRISYHENWQLNHWRSIESAYRKSPFFEYFDMELIPYYENFKPQFLLDFNEAIFNKINELIDLSISIKKSKTYLNTNETLDYRTISPKNKVLKLDFEPYIQVFGSKMNFVPNLSILDIFFNEGNNTKNYLATGVKAY